MYNSSPLILHSSHFTLYSSPRLPDTDKCLLMTADWYKMFYEGIDWKTKYNEQGGVVMEQVAVKDYVKIPKQEYNLLKEIYRTVKRQAFLVRIDESERNLAAGKTKAISVDNFINAVHFH